VSATDSPERYEVLSATLLEKTGPEVALTAVIERPLAGVTLGETVRSTSRTSLILAPVYRIWGRPVPGD
jgi:hypothetical protein